MNILSNLSLRSLKMNKKRTISTIIGIILSVALICAVSSMGLSFQATLVENAINESGYYHIRIDNVTDKDIKDIQNNRDVKEIYTIKRCGYAKLEGSKNDGKPYVQLSSMNNETFENLKFKLIEGKFPSNSNELIITKTINTNGELNYKIGDTLTLDIGERKTNENYDLDGSNPFNKGLEKIVNTKTQTFKIVGIIERPDARYEGYSDPGYTVISKGFDTGKTSIFVSLKDAKKYKNSIPKLLGLNSYNDLNVIKSGQQARFESYEINSELLRWEAFAFSDSTVSMLYSVICVVIVIIIFTSVFCIRNSFAIATTEKTKMYSMLASVGTTKKQIRRNVITEGLSLGIIGIPLGILCGFLATFILIQIVNALLGDYLLANVDGLVFKIDMLSILISGILGIVTIYLSARSSARKASKISPIEGLRSSNDIKIKGKKLRVPFIISKTFKTGGVLAYKNLKRNKKKYRTTVISITVSIFIFITMNTFITNAFEMATSYYTDYSYNMSVSGNNLNDVEIKQIISHPSIEKYSLIYQEHTPNLHFRITDLSKINQLDTWPISRDEKYDEETGKYTEVGELYSEPIIMALDSKAYERFAKKIGVNYKDIKENAVLCDTSVRYDQNTGKQIEARRYTLEKGDIIEENENNHNIKIKIGAISKVRPDGLENWHYDGGYLIINKDEFKDLKFSLSSIIINSNDTTALEKYIEKINNTINVNNIEEQTRAEKAMVLVVKIFLYGFIAVISLIGVTNIFNTVTSNMELRQKEFATLKSVGMTKKEFNRMINLETIFYGTKSWIYGTILGLIGTFALYKAFSVKIEKGIYIPTDAILISAIFVFIFIFIIMKYSIKKINKQNTIETIRNENI